MKNLLKLLVNSGIDETVNMPQRQDLRTLNRIAVHILLIVLFMTSCMTYLVQDHAWFILTVSFVEIILLSAVLALNSVQQFLFARQVFMFNTSFIILLLVGYYGIQSNYHYIAPISFLSLLYLFREGTKTDFYAISINLTFCLSGILFFYLTDFSIVSLTDKELEVSRLGAYVASVMVTVSIGSILFINSRHRSELTRKYLQDLSGQSKMLASISENLDEGLFKVNKHNRFEYINDSFVDMFGYANAEEVLKLSAEALYSSPAKHENILNKLTKARLVHNELVSYKRKDGSLFYGRLSCNKILEKGQDKIVGIITDVTFEHEQNEQIKQSELRLREAQRIAKLGNFRLFEDDYAMEWSDESFRIHGFSSMEYTPDLNTLCSCMLHIKPNDFINKCTYSKTTNQSVEFGDWYTDTTGNKKYLKYKVRFVDYPNGQTKSHWTGTVQDITHAKKMEEELEATSLFFKSILDQAPVEMALLDSDFNYVFLSERAIVNQDIRKWIIGKNDFEYCKYRNKPISLAESRFSYLTQSKTKKVVVRWEEEIIDNYGRINYFFRNIVPIVNPIDGKEYFAGFGFNVTRLRESQVGLEKKNEELNKLNQELDRFVYSISHDLRAPVASVLGLISLAEESSKLEDTKEILKMQREALDRLDVYIRDVIDYSRNKRLAPSSQKLSIANLVNVAMTNLAYLPTINQIEFFYEYENGDDVVSDQMRVQIVINNLLSNAIKYLDRNKEHSFIRVATKRENNGLTLTVQDNGVGIHSEYEERVWEMFYRGTSESSGSGLGLYILKESLAAIEGTVDLETELGKGTKFTVYIPDAE